MGATLLLAIFLWLAGAFVEFKIVRAIPGVAPLFHGLTGIVISITISMTLGFFIAPAAGVAVALAATMGMATNEFTYKLFSNLESGNRKRKEVQMKISTFKHEHPTVFAEAVEGIKAGFKVIAAIVLAVVWLFGLPVRIIHWIQAAKAAVFTRKVTVVS
jgi:hypothetical protein